MPVLMPVAPPPPMAMPLQQQHTFIPQEDPVAKKPKVAGAFSLELPLYFSLLCEILVRHNVIVCLHSNDVVM